MRTGSCLVCFLCLLIAGCNPAGSGSNPPGSAAIRIKTELQPEGSGEVSRVHKFDRDGLLLETTINFRSGEMAVATFVQGELVEYKRSLASQVQLHTKLVDGLIVWQEENRNGGVQLRWQKQENGDLELNQFYEGRLSDRLIMHADGSGESGEGPPKPSFWGYTQKQSWKADGSLRVEFRFVEKKINQLVDSIDFDPQGNATAKHYQANGKVLLRAQWQNCKNSANRPRGANHDGWLLKEAETRFDNKEVVVYTYDNRLSSSDPNASRVEITAPDGSKRVIEAKPGDENVGQAGSVKLFDAGGKAAGDEELTQAHSQRLVTDRNTFGYLQAPQFHAADHLRSIRQLFAVDPVIRSLSLHSKF
ncbi:MAG: hypothetical protein K2W82_11245 [Candidatus Obscuribacterales bacterium]|nr:hypothetical protein [Candidatus Obscuribacterales bacterium]